MDYESLKNNHSFWPFRFQNSIEKKLVWGKKHTSVKVNSQNSLSVLPLMGLCLLSFSSPHFFILTSHNGSVTMSKLSSYFLDTLLEMIKPCYYPIHLCKQFFLHERLFSTAQAAFLGSFSAPFSPVLEQQTWYFPYIFNLLLTGKKKINQ